MNWSDSAWQQSAHIYTNIIDLPFIRELISGSLPAEKFKFYIEQDSNYLEQYARVLALIGARCNQTQHALAFIRFAEGALVVENALHAGYFTDMGIKEKAPFSPACQYYTSYLLSTAALDQVEVAIAAVMPCFWIYKKVGDYIYQHPQHKSNPYKKWIDTYAGEDFGELVKKAIAICDEAAQECTPLQRQKMTDAFVTACKLEWLFWDSAWNLQTWQV